MLKVLKIALILDKICSKSITVILKLTQFSKCLPSALVNPFSMILSLKKFLRAYISTIRTAFEKIWNRVFQKSATGYLRKNRLYRARHGLSLTLAWHLANFFWKKNKKFWKIFQQLFKNAWTQPKHFRHNFQFLSITVPKIFIFSLLSHLRVWFIEFF